MNSTCFVIRAGSNSPPMNCLSSMSGVQGRFCRIFFNSSYSCIVLKILVAIGFWKTRGVTFDIRAKVKVFFWYLKIGHRFKLLKTGTKMHIRMGCHVIHCITFLFSFILDVLLSCVVGTLVHF